MKIVRDCKFIGELPKVVVQAPMIKLSEQSVLCTGCNNIVACLDVDKAICPLCVSNQIKEQTNENTK